MAEGWAPDPLGRYEERWHADGQWTDRVRHWGIETRDPIERQHPVQPEPAPAHAAPEAKKPSPSAKAGPTTPAPEPAGRRPGKRTVLRNAVIALVAVAAVVGAGSVVLDDGGGDGSRTPSSNDSTTAPARPAGPLQPREGMVFVDDDYRASDRGELPAEEPTQQVWAVDACGGGPCLGDLVIAGDVVVGIPSIATAAADGDATVVAFDLDSGEELWSHAGVGAETVDTPEGVGLLVLENRTDGSADIYGFGADAMRVDPRSGDDLWEATARVEKLGIHSASDEVFYSFDGDEHGGNKTMTGISTATGELLWSFDDWNRRDDTRWTASPYCGGYAFKPTGSDVSAIDLETGDIDWVADVAFDQDLVSAACTDDSVYFSGGWSGGARAEGEENGSSPLYEVDLSTGDVLSERTIDTDLFAVVDGALWTATPFTPSATDLVVLDGELSETARTEGVFQSFSGIDAMDDEIVYIGNSAPVAVDRASGALRDRCECPMANDSSDQNSWMANGLVKASASGLITAYRLPDFVESWSVEVSPTDGDPPRFAAANGTLVVIDDEQIRALRAPG